MLYFLKRLKGTKTYPTVFYDSRKVPTENALLGGLRVGRVWQTSEFGNRSRRNQSPNIVKTTFYSELFDERWTLMATTKVLRSVDRWGGIDEWLLNANNKEIDGRLGFTLKFKVIHKLLQTENDERRLPLIEKLKREDCYDPKKVPLAASIKIDLDPEYKEFFEQKEKERTEKLQEERMTLQHHLDILRSDNSVLSTFREKLANIKMTQDQILARLAEIEAKEQSIKESKKLPHWKKLYPVYRIEDSLACNLTQVRRMFPRWKDIMEKNFKNMRESRFRIYNMKIGREVDEKIKNDKNIVSKLLLSGLEKHGLYDASKFDYGRLDIGREFKKHLRLEQKKLKEEAFQRAVSEKESELYKLYQSQNQ